jgi:hypothetical protein
MQTESQVFEEVLSEFISEVERRIARLEAGDMDDADEIELAALECLLERLEGLDGYDAPES